MKIIITLPGILVGIFLPTFIFIYSCGNSQTILSPGSNTGHQDSPFGIHEVMFYRPEEITAIEDLGATSARIAPYGSLIWDMIETERGKYDWSVSDMVITAGYDRGIKLFVTIGVNSEIDGTGGRAPHQLPVHLDWYLEFLQKAVERYDGDGIEDAPNSPKIDVVQICNEVDGIMFWDDTPQNYALLLKESYKTVKKASTDMKVAIAGVATPEGFYNFYKPILEELNRIKDSADEQYFDIFDFHWSGQFPGDNDYAAINLPGGKYEMRDFVSDIKNELEKIGYKNIDFYITEMSDYSDTPAGYSYHTESYHAAAIIKRYIYSLASGVDKIFWTQLIEQNNFGGEENGYFDNVGLINNPQNDGKSHKKLAYYTYKLMVDKLEDSDWSNIEIIQEENGIYIYNLNKQGKPIWIAWNDNLEERQVVITGINSNQVKISEAIPGVESGANINESEYPNFFNTETKSVSNGKITITLGENPVFVEEIECIGVPQNDENKKTRFLINLPISKIIS